MKTKFKGVLKSLLAMTLALVMVVGAAPLSVFAQGEDTSSENSMQVQGSNDAGNIIMSAVENDENADNDNGYGVSDLTMEGKTAKVRLSAPDDCKLIVAIYDETTMQMLGSGMSNVGSESYNSEVTIDIGIMPQYYVVKAFIVYADNSAVCKSYTSNVYTNKFQQFIKKTTDDFDSDLVVNFDEDKTNNFAVLVDGAVKVESTDKKNTLKSADEEKDIYVITNAEEAVRDLKSGDVLYLIIGEGTNDFRIIEVDTISVSGNTVTINSNEETLGDVFEYIKIDMGQGLSNEDVQNAELGSALALIQTQAKARAKGDFYGNDSKSETLKAGLEYEAKDHVTIKGTLELKTNIEIKLYYDVKIFGDDYFEYRFNVGVSLSLHGEAAGKIDVDKNAVYMSLAKIPVGPFEINIDLYPEIAFSGKIEIEIKVETSILQQYDPHQGERRVVQKNKDMDASLKNGIELKFGIGLRIKVNFVGLDVASASISGSIGLKFSGKVDGYVKCLLDKYHLCDICVEGDITFYVNAGFDVKIELNEKLKWNLVDYKYNLNFNLGSAHISWINGEVEFGFGKCGHKLYAVEFNVENKSTPNTTAPVVDAIIDLGADCYVDVNGDGKISNDEKAVTYVKTNKDGKAVAYYFNGFYSYDVSVAGQEPVTRYLIINNGGKSVFVDVSIGTGAGDTTYTDEKYFKYKITSGVATVTGLKDGYPADINIPKTLGGYPVTSIGYQAFAGCDSLTSVTIPDSVTSIGDRAFSSCTRLTSITIPNSVTSIGYSAFCLCDRLTNITVGANNKNYSSRDGVLFNKDQTLLIQYPIGNQRKEYTIPDSVTSIGEDAFYLCDSLTSVTIPNSVTSIGVSAFYGCDSLTSVTIPNSVTSIGYCAFYCCGSLTSVTIPDGVTSIGIYAFYGCDRLTNITVGANNKNYSSRDGVLFNKDQTLLIQYPIGNQRKEYTIPDSVTSIGNRAFGDCDSLTSITIPNSVTSIGVSAFSGCSRLTNVSIPNSVTSIGDAAFYSCDSLTSITIPDSVTSIGDSAFEGCDSLTSVTIPNSVTSIGDSAFEGCDSLTSVTIPNSVTSIGEDAFYLCDSLTSVIIPNSVTSIGNYAFSYCGSLTDVYYAGTEEQWSKISIGSNNGKLIKATIHYNSISPKPAVASLAPKAIKAKAQVAPASTALAVTCENAIPGNYYMIYAYTGDMNYKYIDQSMANGNRLVTFDYNPMDYSGEITVVVVGDFGNGVETQTVTPKEPIQYSMKFDNDDIVLNAGEKYQLGLEVTPDIYGYSSLILISSDESVATVSHDGTVTAVSKGTAQIEAWLETTDGYTVKATATVTVNEKVDYAVSWSETDVALNVGENHQLVVTMNPEINPEIEYPIENAWCISSDPSVATVDNMGLVTAVSAGVAQIEFGIETYDGTISRTVVTVTVTDPNAKAAPVSIEIVSLPAKLTYNYKADTSTEGLKVIAKYADGTELDITDKVEVKNFEAKTKKQVGEKTATVEFEGMTAEFTYTVKYAWWQHIIRILLLGFIWYDI